MLMPNLAFWRPALLLGAWPSAQRYLNASSKSLVSELALDRPDNHRSTRHSVLVGNDRSAPLGNSR